MADAECENETMEENVNVDKNDDMSSDENDSADSENDSDDDEKQAMLKEKIEQLKQQLTENPYAYDNHVELIKNLREHGDLDALREARDNMSKLFPLAEELWLEWLQDEVGLVSDESSRAQVTQLFERAVKDYLSVPVWLEYVQFSIGGMGEKEGIKTIRDTFDRALTACGLHVTKGGNLWEAYREFENAILAGLLPAPGSVPTKAQEDQFSEQHDRVQALFKRQLTVPLQGVESAYSEYKEWLQDEPDKQVKQTYNKARMKLEKIQPYENKLAEAEAPRLAEYQEYLVFEEKEGDPARIQCLYERAVQENCLNTDIWLQYTKYLDHKLRVSSVSVDVYERSIRNCPWCVQLWQNYLLTLERSGQPYEKVKGVFEAALQSGFTHGSEYLGLWTTFIDYLRRRIKWEQDHEEDLKVFRLSIESAIQQVDGFGQEGDPNGQLRQLWAVIEAKHCKNLEKSRKLWQEIMAAGRANEAALWLENYRFERQYGDAKHCRRVLQRALNSVTDWPETVVDAYINFERIEGNLEQYEQAVSKCAAQMARINERREKDAENQEQPKKFDKKGQHPKGKPQKFDRQHNRQQQQQKQQGKHQQPDKPGRQGKGQKWNTTETVTDIKPYKRKNVTGGVEPMETSNTDSEGFKKPSVPSPSKSPKSTPPPGFKGEGDKSAPPPGYKAETNDKSAPPPGYKGGAGEKSAPPPGYKRGLEEGGAPPGYKGEDEVSGPPEKKLKTESHVSVSQPGEADCMVFVSNLAFKVDEQQIRDFFKKCGHIDEIRLVKNFKGLSKGYAYVQFADQLAVANALSYDRTPVDGRPMYVSKYEDRSASQKTKADFKYSTSLEKNKLFIKNLPFTCTKEALTTLFSQHGELKDVRLVTYRSGASKGLAYVDFVDEQCAAQAILKTDGIKIGEHEISVAISNPPFRKAQQRDETNFLPSLGGGKKETQSRGVARTQVALMPRSVAKKTAPVKPASAGAAQSKEASSSETQSGSINSNIKSSGMSNSDFRSMLLKK